MHEESGTPARVSAVYAVHETRMPSPGRVGARRKKWSWPTSQRGGLVRYPRETYSAVGGAAIAGQFAAPRFIRGHEAFGGEVTDNLASVPSRLPDTTGGIRSG